MEAIKKQPYILQFNLDGADMDERERKALMFALEQQKKKKYLEGAGVMFYTDECTVKLAESFVNDEYLELCMRCLKNDGNQLVYVLFEKKGDTEYGIERKEQRISDKQIEEQKIAIDNIVKSFTGVYVESLSSIKVNISIIHNYRLLRGIRSIDSERLPMNEIINGLKDWLMEHINDSRVGVTEIMGEKHIVLLCPVDYRKGIKVGGIFKEIFSEIAPKNNFSAFKAELYRRNLLICDKNDDCIDIQKSISRAKCLELGTNNVRIICFNFEPEFVKAYIEAKELLDILKEMDDADFDMMFEEGNSISSMYEETED